MIEPLCSNPPHSAVELEALSITHCDVALWFHFEGSSLMTVEVCMGFNFPAGW